MSPPRFGPKEKVWAWSAANQTFEIAELERYEPHKNLCWVKLGAGAPIELKEDLVHKVNSPSQDGVADNTFMRELNEATLLHNVRTRYSFQKDDGGCYSYTGHILIAVNPFRELDIYSEHHVRMRSASPRRAAFLPSIPCFGHSADVLLP